MLGFTIITALAAIFRITYPEIIEFKADEAINLFLAARPIFGHPFLPGATVSSIGLLNPPLINYLLYPFTLLTTDPKIISVVIGLINALAIGFFFLILKKYYGYLTALFSSLLMAFSPWMILFSRKIWAQDLLIPFVIILLLSIHKLAIDKKTKYWFVYALSSLFLIQLHQASIILIAILTIFLIRKVKINIPYLSGGIILGILPMLPYFIYVLNNFWFDPLAIIVPKERFASAFYPIIFLRPLQILSQGNFRFILGEDNFNFANQFPMIYQLKQFFYLEYLLLPLGIILFFKHFKKLRFLIYAIISLPIIYYFLHFEPFIHYVLILTPLLFLFLGFGLKTLFDSKFKLIKFFSLGAMIILVTLSFFYNLAFFQFIKDKKEIKGDYGNSFGVIEKQTREKFAKYQGSKDYQEIILASYLPGQFLYGYMPVAKMLYPYKKTLNDLPALEKRLLTNPDDPRVKLQLTAFYTTYPVTKHLLNLLKIKSEKIPGYLPIYESVSSFFGQK